MAKTINGSNIACRVPFSLRALRGVTMIEVLVAALIVGFSLAALVSMWYFSFRLSVQSNNVGVSYNIARKAMEKVKQLGFQNAAEGTNTVYYDKDGNNSSTTQNSSHAYEVTTTVSSDLVLTGTPVKPAPNALRTVTVTVVLLRGNQTIYQSSTYLARSGI